MRCNNNSRIIDNQHIHIASLFVITDTNMSLRYNLLSIFKETAKIGSELREGQLGEKN